MSGTALAQQQRQKQMMENRRENYETHGEHEKVLVHHTGDYMKCFDCGKEFRNDATGWDILKEENCK
jgi:hypothetical protein